MYISGHLLASATIATVVSKKLKTGYVVCATLMMIANFIDVDHLFQYKLDDGTVNSLTLHYAHVYAGAILFLTALSGVIFPKIRTAAYILLTGISFHLFCDAFANLIHYNIMILGIIDILLFITLLVFLKKNSTEEINYTNASLFFFLVLIIGNGTQLFVDKILSIKPNQSPIPYGIAAVYNLVFPLIFYFLFRKQENNRKKRLCRNFRLQKSKTPFFQ